MKNVTTATRGQQGQSLVLILLVLVIGATVAFAIASRTIQEIKRVGQERSSEEAGDTVISLLDSVTGETLWNQIIANGDFLGDLPDDGVCADGSANRQNPYGAEICVLDDIDLDSLGLGDLGCDEGTTEIQIRKENGVLEQPIAKDDVYEINLTGDISGGTMTLDEWIVDGDEGGHLVFKFYYQNPADGSWNIDREVAVYYTDMVGTWGVVYVPGMDIGHTDYAGPQYVRIRSIGANSTVSIGAIPGQQFTIRGSCYVSDTYREFVRIVPLNDYVPVCFDYVLFDGTTSVDERSPL